MEKNEKTKRIVTILYTKTYLSASNCLIAHNGYQNKANRNEGPEKRQYKLSYTAACNVQMTYFFLNTFNWICKRNLIIQSAKGMETDSSKTTLSTFYYIFTVQVLWRRNLCLSIHNVTCIFFFQTSRYSSKKEQKWYCYTWDHEFNLSKWKLRKQFKDYVFNEEKMHDCDLRIKWKVFKNMCGQITSENPHSITVCNWIARECGIYRQWKK